MQRNFGILLGVATVVLLVSVIILGVGIHRRISRKTPTCTTDEKILTDFLTQVQNAYYENNPNKIVFKPGSGPTDTRNKFMPFDCKPSAIKKRTDEARRLYREVNKLQIAKKNLNTRERRAFAQVKHYLQNNFGTPFDENYYIGDWMLGPNLFCWQPICSIDSDFRTHFNTEKFGFQPTSLGDLEYVIDVIKKYGATINQYVENMKMGVLAGMVRSEEQCKAGIDAIKGKFPKIVESNETGILKEAFVSGVRKSTYLSKLPKSVSESWKQRTGKMINVSIDEYLIQHMGRPLSAFIKYLINDHYTHCTPSAEHSGLATLPLDYVWVNRKEDKSRPTTKKLPTGETLSGKKAYEAILPYFTTIDMSPNDIYDLGERQLNVLYPRALEIAKNLTKVKDTQQAARQFKSTILDSPASYFNATIIPSNETGEVAHKKCKTMDSASKYCPVRYNAMVSWFNYVQTVLAKLDPMTVKFFYFTGNKSTTPNCPLQMVAKFNPSSGSQSYSGAGKLCSRPCNYYLPFWLTPPGPRWNAISVGGHEGRPGHHTQVQGFNEHFSSSDGGKPDVIDWLNGETYYTAFTEGWALYAENPLLAQGTDIYKDNKLQEYGMLKWQIWRALRLMIDTGLHYKGMKRQKALDLFEKYAWDTGDKAVKDVTRYQSSPGQATGYMIGQLAIWRIRNDTITKFKANNIKFSEQEFHFYLLSQGSAPLSYLESFMKDYVSCKINNKQDICASVLNPLGTRQQTASDRKEVQDRPIEPKPFHEHYD